MVFIYVFTDLYLCSKKGKLAITRRFRVPIDMSNVDLSEYEHYWSKEEDIPGLDLSETWTPTSMLAQIHKQLEDAPPLLERNFKQVHDGKTECQMPKIKVMQWNILAQGRSWHHGKHLVTFDVPYCSQCVKDCSLVGPTLIFHVI